MLNKLSGGICSLISHLDVLIFRLMIAGTMKYIFLDIDGVFNSSDYSRSIEYLTETAGMSDAQIMLIAHHTHLDPKAIKVFDDLVERSGATVILSSTWRWKYSVDEMNEMLKGRGAKFTIAAATPILFGKISSRIPRGKEIAEFIKVLPEVPESFVIIDDHDDMLHLKTNLVQTDPKHGITPDDVEKALKVLNGEK